MNSPALTMFHRFISITNIMAVIAINKIGVINTLRHLLCQEVEKNTISQLVVNAFLLLWECKIFLTDFQAMKKQTPTYSLQPFSPTVQFIIQILVGGNHHSCRPLVFHLSESGKTQTDFEWPVFQWTLLLGLCKKNTNKIQPFKSRLETRFLKKTRSFK